MREARLSWRAIPICFLPTAQIGISVVSAFGAAYGGHQIVGEIRGWLYEVVVADRGGTMPMDWRLAYSSFAYTYVSLILGELVPKRAVAASGRGLGYSFGADRAFHLGNCPAVRLVHGAFDAAPFCGRCGSRPAGEPSVSLDDIEHLIDTGTAEGVVEPLEQKLVLWALCGWAIGRSATSCGRGSIWMRWTSTRRRTKFWARWRWRDSRGSLFTKAISTT